MNFGKKVSQESVEYSLSHTLLNIQAPDTPMKFTNEDVSFKEIYDVMNPNKK
jgi:hypothetical protein